MPVTGNRRALMLASWSARSGSADGLLDRLELEAGGFGVIPKTLIAGEAGGVSVVPKRLLASRTASRNCGSLIGWGSCRSVASWFFGTVVPLAVEVVPAVVVVPTVEDVP